jgi:hypothetical protein
MDNETRKRTIDDGEIGDIFTVTFEVAREYDPINYGAFISKIEAIGQEMGFDIVL